VEVKKGGVHYNGGKLRNVGERARELCIYKGNYLAIGILWSIVCDLLSAVAIGAKSRPLCWRQWNRANWRQT